MYFGLWNDKSDVCGDFQIDSFEGTVLFAAYEYEDYSGQAEVIFVHDGKFYYAGGSHCSCYGLEHQWAPEVIEVAVLRHMAEHGSGMFNEFRKELLAAIEIVENLNLDGAKPETVEVALKLAFG